MMQVQDWGDAGAKDSLGISQVARALMAQNGEH